MESSECYIFIDNKQVRVQADISVLEAALSADIYIPHLCYWKDEKESSRELLSRGGSTCRLCFVEIEGQDRPVCACEQQVFCGMRVTTQGVQARHLALSAFELLLAEHEVSCSNCTRNAGEELCEFKKIARWFGVSLKTKWLLDTAGIKKLQWSIDKFRIKQEKCVHCGRCIHVCEATGNNLLGFAARGLDTSVIYGGDIDMVQDLCAKCQKCLLACPASALELFS